MINPLGMTWQDWASSVILTSGDAWSFGKPPAEEYWQDFAVGFLKAPTFSKRIPPDPYQFSNWRDWAIYAYSMLEGTD